MDSTAEVSRLTSVTSLGSAHVGAAQNEEPNINVEERAAIIQPSVASPPSPPKATEFTDFEKNILELLDRIIHNDEMPGRRTSESKTRKTPAELARSHIDEFKKGRVQHAFQVWETNLNNLLIFAALFSAINSGFLALSLPSLGDNSPAETNGLLIVLIHTINNSAAIPATLVPAPFNPNSVDVAVNALFSISLTLSLLASFGALLAQQWVLYRKRPMEHVALARVIADIESGEPPRTEQTSNDLRIAYKNAQRYRLGIVIEVTLPTLLQLAVLVFTIGFIILLYRLSSAVAVPNLVFVSIGLGCFTLSVSVSLWDLTSPFRTPLTDLIRWVFRMRMTPEERSELELRELGE